MRLTDDRTAKALKEISDKLKAGGFEVDVSNERYIKLAEYESKIVHCKDCKYNLLNREGFKPDALDIVCDYFGIVNLKENDYCSRGVRVDDEQEI